MPEGPELHLAARLVNNIAAGRIFSGKVLKSVVSTKNPDVDWDEASYKISATSRGKEVKLTLSSCSDDTKTTKKKKKASSSKTLDIVFRFGMSGKFNFEQVKDMHKHAHLQFYTKEDDMVLSFTDYRRFGKWEPGGDWGKDRGPCVILEYEKFRENVLENLDNAAFNKPICETLLNQKFFNGIGNYLRAEILYRLGIAPFTQARKVLEPLAECREVKNETPDILQLCHLLPNEVLKICDGLSTGYDVEGGKDYTAFDAWLQCYYQDGMTNAVDHNGRTIWFKGPAGPMAPSTTKTRKKEKCQVKEETESPAKKAKTKASDESTDKTDKSKVQRSKKGKNSATTVTIKKENGLTTTNGNFSPKKTRSRVAAMKKEQVHNEETPKMKGGKRRR